MSSRRVCIVGRNGYISSALRKWLEKFQDSYQVTAIAGVGLKPEEVSFHGVDVVVFGAGIAHRSASEVEEAVYEAVNCGLAVDTARRARADGVEQFIYLSSMSVYGATRGRVGLDTPMNPTTPYGRSKLHAEKELAQLEEVRFGVCILRPPMVYGAGCPGNYAMLRSAARKLPLFPRVENRRSMIYIENLCAWIQRAIDGRSRGIQLPQDPFYTCTSDMVRFIAEAHGKQIFLLGGFGSLMKKLPLTAAKKAFGDLWYPDADRAEGVVTTLQEAVQKTEKGGKE